METESEERVKLQFDEVCDELNLDQEAKETAWESYIEINNDYVLEGSQIEWLACSLYIACRSITTQTMDGEQYSGNSISLTQILRTTKIKLIEFFRKIKKWLEMAKLPQLYLEKVETLERKFEVISVIFKKYRREFSTIFQLQDGEVSDGMGVATGVGGARGGSTSRPRSRKPTRSRPCTSNQLFHFGWILYIHIKNQFPLISDDLVNSHYLLLCCIDMMCGAAVVGKRHDLLRNDFTPPSLPAVTPDCDSAPSLIIDDYPTILPELCRQFSVIERECLVVRDYYWWPSVRRLFESQVLIGTSLRGNHKLSSHDLLTFIIQSATFQTNYRSLKQTYELGMLEEGEFDERVFLNSSETEHEEEELLGRSHDQNERLEPIGVIYQSPQYLQYGTPLSGREYLSTRENKLTPVSDANQSVIQLHLLLEESQPEPTDVIYNTCSSCVSDPIKSIMCRVELMSSSFLSSFKSDLFESPDNFALVRLQLTQSLYYKLLTLIIIDEERKQKLSTKQISIQLMLEHDYFHKSLFALSAEMVLFSYSSHSRVFPWILSVIDIHCYHFYKVIEVIIKVEPSFPRAIVKHLSKIEEMVLSSLAWQSCSPLFDAIHSIGSVPSYSDVALPSNPIIMTTPTLSSPRFSRLKRDSGPVVSPLSSVRERYSSPSSATSRRQLFTARKNGSGSPLKSSVSAGLSKPHPPLAPKPPQGVVQVTQLKSSSQLDLNKFLTSPPIDSSTVTPSISTTGPSSSNISTVLALTSLIKQQQTLSPQHQNSSPHKNHTPLPGGVSLSSPSSQDPLSLQALVSMANMRSPLGVSPDKVSVPTIMLTVSPSSQAKTPTSVTTPILTTPTSGDTPTPVMQRSSPKKTGSLSLFYRKVYQMSYLRIKDLCERLRLEHETIQKVWTCFEHCLVCFPNMMKDRNIDQLIMCSIYIVAKVLRKEVTFQEIMRQYRHQPQAKSHIYRSVLILKGSKSSHTQDDMSDLALPTSCSEDEGETDEGKVPRAESRGDIIQFYNKVFINQLKDFVLKFSDESNDLVLSPLPVIKRAAMSPRKLAKGHQIFISPLKDSQSALSPLAKTFVVSRSPASEFQELNNVIGSSANRITCKRKLDCTLLCTSPSITSPAKRSNIDQRGRGVHNLLSSKSILHHKQPNNNNNNGLNK